LSDLLSLVLHIRLNKCDDRFKQVVKYGTQSTVHMAKFLNFHPFTRSTASL